VIQNNRPTVLILAATG